MRASLRRKQPGVALAGSLILLMLATLIGLAGAREMTLQERMSAHMYDRSLAFQRAESALRAAEDAITASWRIADLRGVDCSVTTGVPCKVIPASTFIGTEANWVAVDDAHNVNVARSVGRPEYFIQFMGTGRAQGNLGLDANADYGNYGTPYPTDNVAFYRVIARSSAPVDAVDRTMVVLQSAVKRAY